MPSRPSAASPATTAALLLILLCAGPASAVTQVQVRLDVITIEGGTLSNGNLTNPLQVSDTLGDTDTWGQSFATGTATGYSQFSNLWPHRGVHSGSMRLGYVVRG